MKQLKVFTARLQNALSEGKVKMTDEELAAVTQTSVRTAQRYLRELRSAGLIQVEVKRHLHHEFGWCNERILRLTHGSY